MKKGYLLIETIFMLFILSIFVLIYLNTNQELLFKEQRIEKNRTELTDIQKKLYLAMTQPLIEIENSNEYMIEQMSSRDLKIILKNNSLIKGIFVLRHY